MFQPIRKYTRAICLLILMSFSFPQQEKIKVYLIGDSTIADKEEKAYPETGWGMPFAYFLMKL
jgi:hypothetical protein